MFGLTFRQDRGWATFSLGVRPFPNLLVMVPFSDLKKKSRSVSWHTSAFTQWWYLSLEGVSILLGWWFATWIGLGFGRRAKWDSPGWASPALTSKVYQTESTCLRGKSQHFLPIIQILLANKALIAERDARLLSKTVWRSKQMFFPACKGVTRCHVDCSLFGEMVSLLTFLLSLEKGTACLECLSSSRELFSVEW